MYAIEDTALVSELTAMTWVRLDDKFHRNPKQLQLSDGAFRVWVCSWSYCAEEKQLTGFLTPSQALSLVRTYGQKPRVIQELVAAAAWEQLSDGYLIHDYEEYLDRGSADRTRKWRAEKRAREAARETSPGGHGDAGVTSPKRHGDAAVTRAHVGAHPQRVIPDPDTRNPTQDVTSSVKGSLTAPSGQQPRAPADEVTLPSGVQIMNSGNGAFTPTEEELKLVKRYLEITGNQSTGADLVKAREFLGELRYVSVAGMVESIERHVERQRQAGYLWPKTLGGFWKILRADNDYARDHGTTERVGLG
jgi:hypothetical protein